VGRNSATGKHNVMPSPEVPIHLLTSSVLEARLSRSAAAGGCLA
jgi:hypothetical protein